METTVGGYKLFISYELIVAQGDVKNIGKAIESLVIKFDQAANKAYLCGPRSPMATRSYRRISAGSHAYTRAPNAPTQPTNNKINVIVGGASNDDNGANRLRCYIYLRPEEPQVLEGPVPILKCNRNTESLHRRCDHQ